MTDEEIREVAEASGLGVPENIDELAARIKALVAKARDGALDEAARVAVRPIMGNGHSSDTLTLSRYAVETQRAILDLKGPQYLPPRRLK